jgi:hypothetical protein
MLLHKVKFVYVVLNLIWPRFIYTVTYKVRISYCYQ